ncbi:MAG: hypothetical protein FWE33_05010 [Defluviitaleaceae bacterium]|nr:hypothetical protein [Defluviitaleaceae bacterium]
MEKYGSSKIDKQNEIGLHSDLREKMGLEDGAIVTLLPMGKIVILQTSNNQSTPHQGKVSFFGFSTSIILPNGLMEKMGWKLNNEIGVYYVDSDMLVLYLCKERKVYYNGIGSGAFPFIIP